MYANRTVRYIYGGSRQCAKAADPFVHMTMHVMPWLALLLYSAVAAVP